MKIHEQTIETFDNLYLANKDLFIEGIKTIFSSDEKQVNNQIYESLSKLNNGNSFFITTNIDMGLQNFVKLSDQSVSIYPYFSNPPKLINYVHGRVDSEKTWVFTGKQYSEGYSSKNSACMEFLKQIFQNYSVIFFGYGLREREIMMAISKTNKKRQHYWIEPISREKVDHLKIRSISLKDIYNITVVP